MEFNFSSSFFWRKCVHYQWNRFLVHISVRKAKLYQRLLRCCVYTTVATFFQFWTYLILTLNRTSKTGRNVFFKDILTSENLEPIKKYWQSYLTFLYNFTFDRVLCILVIFYQWGHFVMFIIRNLNLNRNKDFLSLYVKFISVDFNCIYKIIMTSRGIYI